MENEITTKLSEKWGEACWSVFVNGHLADAEELHPRLAEVLGDNTFRCVEDALEVADMIRDWKAVVAGYDAQKGFGKLERCNG